MKNSLFVVCALLISGATSFAQGSKILRVNRANLSYFLQQEAYKYPSFQNAKIYFNDGDSAGGVINYKYLLQSMQFVNDKNDTLLMDDEKKVNYIAIGTDTFIYNDGFYEVIKSSASAKLAVRSLLKSRGAEKVGAFGIANTTSRIESLDQTGGFNTRKIEANEEFVFTKERVYYISGMKNHFAEANKKNISRLFPKKDVDFYIEKNHLSLDKENDLLQLFAFLNKP